jgi:acetyl esterase/lipase
MRLILMSAVFAMAASAQPKTELLWPNGAPGAQGTADEDKPTLTYYAPKRAKNGTAVVVCPGGGYRGLAMDHEGVQVATWLNSLGITAFVLKYRLGPKYHHPAEMNDVHKAIRTVRARAAEYGVVADKIGVLGFSAGGHLASTAATHFATEDGVSSRPDFAVLVYPVISFTTEYVHKGSRLNLLGENPSEADMRLMSNELQVTKDTPPTFLVHTSEDKGVLPRTASFTTWRCERQACRPRCISTRRGRMGLGWLARCRVEYVAGAPGRLDARKGTANDTPEFSVARGRGTRRRETDQGCATDAGRRAAFECVHSFVVGAAGDSIGRGGRVARSEGAGTEARRCI